MIEEVVSEDTFEGEKTIEKNMIEFSKINGNAVITEDKKSQKINRNKYCLYCGAVIFDNSAFCVECGNAIEKSKEVCFKCVFEFKESGKFCHMCGAKREE